MKYANSTRVTLKEVVLSSRPFWWVATGAPFVAGYMATTGLSFRWPLLVGGLYFLTVYNLLLYGMSDVFNRQSDIRNLRKRGVAGPMLSLEKHRQLLLVIALTNVPFWAYFAYIGSATATVFLLVMAATVLAYSVRGMRFKEVPVLDSFTAGFHYASPFIFGVLLAGGLNLWLPAWLAFYMWAMGSHAFCAIQDIKPDRESGTVSIATKLGSERTLVFVLGLYLTATLLPVLFYGARGLLPSLLLLIYVVLAANTLPERSNPNHTLFRQSWHLVTYLNYINGLLLGIYLLVLAITA